MTAIKLRIGHGIDVHRFSSTFNPDKPLILAGFRLDEELSLLAHSDGDVILHAICDGILGALAAGDIGQHFPDSDQAWKNIASAELLTKVLQLAQEKSSKLVNLDITVVAQIPKLSPHREDMRQSLCRLLHLDADRVNLKATTTEGMGYIGREEGIACHAVVLLEVDA